MAWLVIDRRLDWEDQNSFSLLDDSEVTAISHVLENRLTRADQELDTGKS